MSETCRDRDFLLCVIFCRALEVALAQHRIYRNLQIHQNRVRNSLHIYLRPQVARLLRSRLYLRNASATINEAVGRYLVLCDRARPDFTREEWAAIRASIPLDATGVAVGSIPWSCVEEAERAGLLEEHAESVDVPRLIERLKALALAEEIAVLEIVERGGSTL